MNSRDYKLFRPGQWYHIYNRGHNKDCIFIDNQDYNVFLNRIAFIISKHKATSYAQIKPFKKGQFSIMCYCLMSNHFHLLIRQNSNAPISSLMNKLCTSYAKAFNLKYNKIGSLFQDTFKAKLVDNDNYLTYLSAYIHNNPENPFDYEYSSIHEYLGTQPDRICETQILLKYFELSPKKYKVFVENYNFNQHQNIQHLAFEE